LDIISAVKSAGIVGAGGAGFPTHIKISASADTVLANGAECEPLLYSDQFIMEENAEEVLEGLKLVMEATGAKRGILCIKAKFKEAVKKFETLLEGLEENISLLKLGNFYPSGDEHILVYEATGRIVPEGGIPLAVGVIVQNVGTLSNIAKSVSGKVVTDRVVTVGGEIKDAGVYKFPLGTSIADVIEKCGGSTLGEYAVLLNGPMMGRLINPDDEVITKTSGGVILLPKEHEYVLRMSRTLKADIHLTRGACEQCRYCTDLCPRYLQGHSLEPHKIMRVITEEREPESATVTASFLCCECGLCDMFACPIALSPRVFFKNFKGKLAKRKITNPHSNKPSEVNDYKNYRRVPKDKLTRRLGLSQYEVKPSFNDEPVKIQTVNIPLKMHLGSPAKAVVKAGEKVSRGDLIGEIDGKNLGANIHASISGTVGLVNGSVRITA